MFESLAGGEQTMSAKKNLRGVRFMNVLIDVDDTICDFVSIWLECYGADYNHKLTKEDILTWDLSHYVKPECGIKVYDYLKMDNLNLYYCVSPIDGALEGIKRIEDLGHKIVFVTAMDYRNRKAEWLVVNGFFPVYSNRDYVVSEDKSLIRGDLLIDDNCDNVISFGCEKAWLFTQPWNKCCHLDRVNNWDEIIRRLEKFNG
jgi:5'-nucleotidase